MNLKKAAEIALETLISLEELIPVGSKLAAIDILRKALAQQDRKCEAGPSLQDLWDCWDAVHSEKQEPTAWMDAVGDLTFRTPSVKLRPYWTPLYLHPTPVPEGWQLVPIEPTAGMVEAGSDYGASTVNSGARPTIAGYYVAMLAAAPKPEDS